MYDDYIKGYLLDIIKQVDGWAWLHLLWNVFQQVVEFDNTAFEDIVADVVQTQVHHELVEVFGNEVPELTDMTLDFMKVYLPFSDEMEKLVKEKLRKYLLFNPNIL